ncbi:MAG TPA: FAD:protein FMN transferase, partial [Verrucomicrobiae bacterium]|nr:FAD:protein FMN transferase [Verrucomicrobiae bacterium]
LIVLTGTGFSLINLEGFDAWAWRTAGTVTVVIAVAGLAASVFVPHAYCRFGCPTGALLGFVRSAGSADHWGRRDTVALMLTVIGVLTVVGVRSWPRHEPEPEPSIWTGRTMGTTWTVKIFDEVADPALVEQTITNEFEWAESLTSHWWTNTDLAQFNRSLETNAMPVPWPVVTLTRWAAEISRESDGAFDLTVGPLVKLWGFGPAPRRSEPPSEWEIEAARSAVGWEKLEVQDGLLRKGEPRMEVDLSGIAKGWAIDHIARVLGRRGYTNVLVEAGGEMRALGRWTVAIEHPARSCVISNESLATSGSYRQNYRSSPGQRTYSHLIDPRTGRPVAHHTVAVSVRHEDCARADAWATALNVLGVEQGMAVAERLKLAAQFVTESGDGTLTVQESSEWRARTAAIGGDGALRRPRRVQRRNRVAPIQSAA